MNRQGRNHMSQRRFGASQNSSDHYAPNTVSQQSWGQHSSVAPSAYGSTYGDAMQPQLTHSHHLYNAAQHQPSNSGFFHDPLFHSYDTNYHAQGYSQAPRSQVPELGGQNQQPLNRQIYPSQATNNSANTFTSQGESGIAESKPVVPPGLPIEDQWNIPNHDLVGSDIYSRGSGVTGFPPPLLPFNSSSLPPPPVSGANSGFPPSFLPLDPGLFRPPSGSCASSGFPPLLPSDAQYFGQSMNSNAYLPPPPPGTYEQGMSGRDFNEYLQPPPPGCGLYNGACLNDFTGSMNEGYHPQPAASYYGHGNHGGNYGATNGGQNTGSYNQLLPMPEETSEGGMGGAGEMDYFYPAAPCSSNVYTQHTSNMPATYDSTSQAPNTSYFGSDGFFDQPGSMREKVEHGVGHVAQYGDHLLSECDIPLPSIERD